MNIFILIQSIIIRGTATTFATEFLKSPFIPVAFQKYPRLTTILVAIIASLVSIHATGINISTLHGFNDWIEICLGTLVMSNLTYENLVK